MNLAKIDTIIDGNEESQIVAIGDSGALTGTVCLAHKKKRSACITNLYVGESSRGRGVGRKLVEACCDIATESGCETIGLSLCKGNEQSEFYRKLGFRFCYQYENGDSLLAFFLNPVWHGESNGEWQPIATAPKDGTEYLACDESGKEQIVISQPPHHEKGFWEKDKDGRWCGSACNNNYHYWHHLPSPPQENNHER